MSSNKIVITRPKPQGLDFVKNLCQENSCMDIGNFLFEPLIEIKQIKTPPPDLDIYDGIIVTSKHGKSALPESYECYDVGNYAPTASELVEKIVKDNENKKLRFLYIRAKDISFNMKYALEHAGHKVDELIAYEAVAMSDRSNDFLTTLKNNEISAITFFSRRTASIFVKSVYKYQIIDDLKDIKVLCISDSVLECLNSVFNDNNITVSSCPDAFGMAEIVTSYCKRY